MRKREMTLKKRIMAPLLLLVFVQLMVFLLVFFRGGISKRLRELPVQMLVQSTDTEKDYLRRTLFLRQLRSIEQYDRLAEQIQQVLEQERKESGAIRTDYALNQRITERVTPELIDILHRSGTNGIYMILDGPAAEKSGADTKAGVYIRDFDSSSYAADNSDLFLERGIPRISRTLSIPLSSYWEPGFSMTDQEIQAYYYKPYEAAAADGARKMKIAQYHYVSGQSRVGGDMQSVITYSVPLILEDGELIGVIGLDITTVQMASMMNVQGIGSQDYGVSMYGRWDEETKTFYPMTSRGAMYDLYFYGTDAIRCQPSGFDDAYTVETGNGSLCYATVSEIEVYDSDTPFAGERWAVMNVLSEQELFESYRQIRGLMIFSVALAGVFAVISLMLISSLVLKPISCLSAELREGGHGIHVKLGRLYIREIDYLIDSIEILSASVAGAASRNSNILEIAGVTVGVFEYNPGTSKVFCNRMMCQMMEWEIPEEDFCYIDAKEMSARMQVLKEQKADYPGVNETENRKNNIYHFKNDENEWRELKVVRMENGSIVGVLTDVTKDVLQRMKLEYDRSYDSLTGLYNRRAFREQVERILKERRYPVMAMVMWDLDNLKYINDTYGHDEGDRYLVAFVRQLMQMRKEGGILCRYSGDEFYAFFYGEDKETIRKRLSIFMEELSRSVFAVPGKQEMPIRASGGVAWCPDDAEGYDTLIRYADFAMYTVKHSVKGNLREYNAVEYREKSYMLAGREELNQLLECRQVPFALQPVMNRDGALYGYELLMRPQLKVLRDISEVLNLAREQAKLSQMEELTWRAGLACIDEHVKAGRLPEGLRYFINSIASVRLDDRTLDEVTEAYGHYFKDIVVELTESEPVNPEYLQHKLALTAKWGAQIAVDDFGSGYNSESVLADMNADIVKLDMRLIRNIQRDTRRQVLVGNVIRYAKEMGIRVLAEGVEDEAEFLCLLDMDVDYFQGYYIGRPETRIMPFNAELQEKIRKFRENRG